MPRHRFISSFNPAKRLAMWQREKINILKGKVYLFFKRVARRFRELNS